MYMHPYIVYIYIFKVCSYNNHSLLQDFYVIRVPSVCVQGKTFFVCSRGIPHIIHGFIATYKENFAVNNSFREKSVAYNNGILRHNIINLLHLKHVNGKA